MLLGGDHSLAPLAPVLQMHRVGGARLHPVPDSFIIFLLYVDRNGLTAVEVELIVPKSRVPNTPVHSTAVPHLPPNGPQAATPPHPSPPPPGPAPSPA